MNIPVHSLSIKKKRILTYPDWGVTKVQKKRKTVEYGKYGYIFLVPFFLVFLIFQFYPLLYTFYISFFKQVQVGHGRKASIELVPGLNNYTDYVFGSLGGGEVFNAIIVTIVMWLLNFVPQILLSLLLAGWFTDAFNKLRGEGAYKVIMYMPNIITAATIAVLFYSFFDVNGSITGLLKSVGILNDNSDILKSGYASLFIIAFIQFWMWYGNTMIVLIAGIMGISPSLYEAAMVDGATPTQQFWLITMPLLKPILQFTLVTSAIGGLQMYDIPQLFNKGGPVVKWGANSVNSTQTIIMLVKSYIDAGPKQDYGRAAAYSVILFIITLAISMIFFLATSEKKAKSSGVG
jgi:multiple sugar transport system permease protein